MLNKNLKKYINYNLKSIINIFKLFDFWNNSEDNPKYNFKNYYPNNNQFSILNKNKNHLRISIDCNIYHTNKIKII